MTAGTVKQLGAEVASNGDPDARLVQLGAEVASAENPNAGVSRLGVELSSDFHQNGVIKRLGVEVSSEETGPVVITRLGIEVMSQAAPPATGELTYLAEIECYHPDDDTSPNLLYYSEDLTGPAWSAYLKAPVVTANVATAPDDTETADRITLTTRGTLKQGLNVEYVTDYVLSFYIKLVTATNSLYAGVFDPETGFWMAGYLEPGDAAWDDVNGSTWTRIEIPFFVSTQRYVEILLPWHNAAQDGNTLYVWGVDVKVGDTLTDYAKTSAPPTRTLRFSTVPYTSRATDTPALTHYESRLLQPGLMRRDLFAPGQPGGQISVGYGLVEIINTGDLDDYSRASFDGRTYRLKLGYTDQPLSSFIEVMRATMEQAEFTATRLNLKLRDRTAELDKPVTELKYLGNGTDLEGDETLKDRYKPVVLGHVLNVSPVLVNEAKRIYQVSTTPIYSITGVYEGGMVYAQGADYTSEADLLANAPAASTVRVWPEGGLMRFGSIPTAAITANVIDDGGSTVGRVLEQLAIAAGWPADEISAGDRDDVSASTNYAGVGLYVDNGGSALASMNQIAAGLGVWFGPDRLGTLRMGVLTEPSGTPTLTLTDTEIISLERRAQQTLPAKKITLKYQKNWTVQPDVLGAVDPARRDWLKQEYRQVVEIHSRNAITRKLSPELDFESLISTSISTARANIVRLIELYGVPREILSAEVRIVPDTTLTLDLNDVIEVVYPRYGLDAGKLYRVIGLQADYQTGRLEIELWGPGTE